MTAPLSAPSTMPNSTATSSAAIAFSRPAIALTAGLIWSIAVSSDSLARATTSPGRSDASSSPPGRSSSCAWTSRLPPASTGISITYAMDQSLQAVSGLMPASVSDVDVQGRLVQAGHRVGDGDAQAFGQGAGPGQQRVGLAQGGPSVGQQGPVEHGREQVRRLPGIPDGRAPFGGV